MPTHLIHRARDVFYFITFTCYKWLNLLNETNIYDYLTFWFGKLKERGCLLSGYVVMPNHMHLVMYVKSDVQDLNLVIAEAKRFLAYEIVKRLQQREREELLAQLKSGVTASERDKGKQHQVFRLSFDAKPVDQSELGKVLEYVHRNPVAKKWRLVQDYVAYKYSSAGFYELGKESVYELLDIRTIGSASPSDINEG